MGQGRRSGSRSLNALDIEKLNQAITGKEVSYKGTKAVVASQPCGSIDDVESILTQTIQLLAGPGVIYGSPGLESLLKWEAALSERSGRLRVSVVGDFKAGKSTLINAVLRRNVCFVDEFEATGVRAVYCDGSPESAELTLDNGEKITVTVDGFLARCARRDTKGIKSVRVTLESGLPFDLADSPGLGTLTHEHAHQAEEEVRRTDLLVFAVDCSDPGGAQESTMVVRAREIGLPILVILTKSDVLGEGDEDLLVKYMSDELGVPEDDIIAVSAKKHVAGGDQGTYELIERLLLASSSHREHWQAAQTAKRREVAASMRIVLKNLLEQNEPNARFITAELAYLEASAADVSRVSKEAWLATLREEVSDIINSSAIQEAPSAGAAKEALQQKLEPAMVGATKRFLGKLHDIVRDEWKKDLQAKADDYQRRLTDMISSQPNQVDLSFLEAERDSFATRATLVSQATEDVASSSRLLHVGLGAAAAILTASFAPLAIGAIAAAFLVKEERSTVALPARLDPALNSKLQDQLVGVFQQVAPEIDEAIDRIVAEVAIRSLNRLAKDAGRPDIAAIVAVERIANDLIDELGDVQI